MPTITGNRQGGSTGPYLTLQWDVLQTDVANNRSRVRLILRLHADYTVRFSASKSGELQGSGFSYTSGANGTGSWELRRQEVWVSHNSDGSKTQNFGGSFNIAITYSGTRINSLSVSGNATLPVIPRASTLSAFSFGANLKNGVANSIKYTIDRKSGNFRHSVQLRDGNTTVWNWDNQNTDGSNTIELTASNVNTLLNRMSNVTSKTFTLRVATRSGVNGGWIGSAVSMTATATVHTDVKPSVGSFSITQTGNTLSNHLLQGISKVKGEFVRSAGYGASIVSNSFTIRRKGSNNDVQTVNSNNGTTSRAPSLHGTYEAQATVRDSRGRTSTSAWVEFHVTQYNNPRITHFSLWRRTDAPTTVDLQFKTTHTTLGTSNPLSYNVQRRQGTGSWTNVTTNGGGNYTGSPMVDGTARSVSNSVGSSYEFRVVVADQFGNRAEMVRTISTQRVVLDIHKNDGVGIGKIRERGVLDVDGTVFFRGGVTMNSYNPNGHGYFNFTGSDGTRKAWLGIGSETTDKISINAEDGDYDIELYTRKKILTRNGQIASMGSNSSGTWYRFYNGLQITTSRVTINMNDPQWQTAGIPTDWVTTPSASWTFVGFPATGDVNNWRNGLKDVYAFEGSNNIARILYSGPLSATTGQAILTLIGRWY